MTIFPKAHNHIKYLGIKIGNTPSSIYYKNFPPLIDRIEKDLKKWTHLPLSLFGKVHLFKITALQNYFTPCN